MTPWLRAGAAVLAASVVATGIALTLAARVPDIRDTPLAPDHAGFAGIPIEVTPAPDGDAGGPRLATVPLALIGDPGWLAAADELHIAFATFLTSPTLLAAEVRDVSGACRFVAPAGAGIRNNASTRFVKAGPCAAVADGPLTLTLRLGREGRVALWTYDVSREDPVPEGLGLIATETADRRHVLRGRVLRVGTGEGPRRAHLLAYLWTGATGSRGIWLAVGLGWLALAGGLGWLAGGASRTATIGGTTLAAAALCGLWAILLPPLQGADEPDHVLTFGVLVQRPIEADLRVLARRTHFERIRFHGTERFRPSDIGHPADLAWSDEVHAERLERRSRLAALLWRLADATVAGGDGTSAASLVLRLRLFNGFIFALCAGAAAALMTWGGASRWALAGLAIMPALVPFGVAVSDWAFVTSAAVLLAGAVVLVRTDQGPEWLRGLALGAAVAVAVAASIAGLALLPLLGILLVVRLVLGPVRADAGESVRFWLGLTAGLAAGIWISLDLFALGYARWDQKAGSDGLALLEAVNAALGFVVRAPWLLLALPLAALAVERGMASLRHSTDVFTAGRRFVLAAGSLLAAGIVGLLTASLFIDYPTLPPMEVVPVENSDHYVAQVLLAFVTSLRLTNLDHLTFTSFWSGFGWIDTILPAGLLVLLSAGTALGLAGGLAGLFHRRSRRQLAWTLGLIAGALASMAALGLAGALMNRNVHGRYLVGVYVPLVVVAWQGWATLAARPDLTGRLTGAALVATLVIAQSVSFITVVVRHY